MATTNSWNNAIAAANSAITLNSGTNTVSISTDASATTLNIGTGAAVKTVQLGSTNTTSSTTINFGGSTGGALSAYIAGTSFTPGITFGGGNTGITYSVQYGRYSKIGDIVSFVINISLTSKGSSTGTALVTGLPFTTNSSVIFAMGTSTVTITTGYIFGLVNAAGTTILVRNQAAAGAAATNLSDTAFANISSISVSGSYIV